MKRNIAFATLLALGATALQAREEGAPLAAPEASIPFVNHAASIRSWEADGVDGIWVQDAHKQWYYAKLIGPCHGLDFVTSVGFETRTSSTLDRFGNVVVPGHGRCAIQSFTKSEGPPEDK
jgi:hypothetical protein